MQRLEKELSSAKDAVEQGREKIAVTEALLSKTKVELFDTAKERDNQMTALATMLSRGTYVLHLSFTFLLILLFWFYRCFYFYRCYRFFYWYKWNRKRKKFVWNIFFKIILNSWFRSKFHEWYWSGHSQIGNCRIDRKMCKFTENEWRAFSYVGTYVRWTKIKNLKKINKIKCDNNFFFKT